MSELNKPPEPPPDNDPLESGGGKRGGDQSRRSDPMSGLLLANGRADKPVPERHVMGEPDAQAPSPDPGRAAAGPPAAEAPAIPVQRMPADTTKGSDSAAAGCGTSQPDSTVDTWSGQDANVTRTAGTDAKPVEAAYERGDLAATGRFDPTYGEEFLLDANKKKHFDGDPVGTGRAVNGMLYDLSNGWRVEDPNPRTTRKLQERAQRDVSTMRTHVPILGASEANDDVITCKDKYDELTSIQQEYWSRLKPIADNIKPLGITITETHTTTYNQALLQELSAHLPKDQLLTLKEDLDDFARINNDIKKASEQLGIAGGRLAIEREFPDATPISGGEAEMGRRDTLDRVVLVDRDGNLVVVEEKGGSGTLGSRIVPDTSVEPGQLAPTIRAEQGSTSYLRDLLQKCKKLDTALRTDPALREQVQTLINGPNPGTLRYLLARTDKEGTVTVIDLKIDADRLHRSSIELPGL